MQPCWRRCIGEGSFETKRPHLLPAHSLGFAPAVQYVSAHLCTATPPDVMAPKQTLLGHVASSRWKINRCDVGQQTNHKQVRHCCTGWFCAACHKPRHYLGRGNLNRKRDASVKLVCGALPLLRTDVGRPSSLGAVPSLGLDCTGIRLSSKQHSSLASS